ncbi:MAG: YbhB/YbcL family Raf kinase inhibitor-like protein [Candidatus Omnitrophota bacterium]
MNVHFFFSEQKILTLRNPASKEVSCSVFLLLVFLQFFLIGGQAMALEFRSSSFSHESSIPSNFTCEGSDISPQLSWGGAPEGTKSFALIADDPDAPAKTWTHWVIYNIPQDSTGLPQDFPHDPALPDGIRQGINDSGETGYGGPCPPPGKPHRYYFRLYALDSLLELEKNATKDQLLRAMKGHILEEAVLMGTYKR